MNGSASAKQKLDRCRDMPGCHKRAAAGMPFQQEWHFCVQCELGVTAEISQKSAEGADSGSTLPVKTVRAAALLFMPDKPEGCNTCIAYVYVYICISDGHQ